MEILCVLAFVALWLAGLAFIVLGGVSILGGTLYLSGRNPSEAKWARWRARAVKRSERRHHDLEVVGLGELTNRQSSDGWFLQLFVRRGGGWLCAADGRHGVHFQYVITGLGSEYALWLLTTATHVSVIRRQGSRFTVEHAGRPLGTFDRKGVFCDVDGRRLGLLKRRSGSLIVSTPFGTWGDDVRWGAIAFDEGPEVPLLDLAFDSEHEGLPLFPAVPEALTAEQEAWLWALGPWSVLDQAVFA
ncbi:MAG: hypothetical protein EP330_14135 [Deltaproteobacteria bacterium]|nr:MAG: hypothetical protein EP330_14135 [Deltaproteobacteria bacterium]